MAFRIGNQSGFLPVLTGASGEKGDLTIPGAIGGVAVKAIGMSAFFANGEITGVTIPRGVIRIMSLAFGCCENVKTVVLPDGLQEIGQGAFLGCRSLRNIVIPDSVLRIGDKAFAGCASLERVVIPKGVQRVGSRAFEGCTSLKSVVFSGNTKVGEDALAGCTALESADLPPSEYARPLPRIKASASLKWVRVAVGPEPHDNSSDWVDWLEDLFSSNPALQELVIPRGAALFSVNVPPECRITRR